MKKGWSEVPLGEILDLEIDAVPVDPTETYPFAGVYGFGRGLFFRDSLKGSDTTYSHFHRLHVGQLVMSQPKGWEGAITVVPEEFEGRFLSAVFPTFRAQPSRLSPKFLRVLTKCKWLWDALFVKSSGIGARRNSVYPEHLLAVAIPLPPIAEQERIAAHFDAIEVRLARAKKLREEQENELKAALSSAFHKLQSDVTWKRLAEVAPLAWRQITIDSDETYMEFGVRSFYKGIFLRRKVAGSTFSWQELYRLKAGDLVFSNIMAWEKAIAIAHPEHDGWVGNHRMLVCEPRPDVVLPSYLLHYFMTSDGVAKILQASPGTAARNKTLKADNLMAIEVPVPSLSHQRTFESLCEHVARVRAAQKPQVMDAAKLLPSLLDRIFNA